MGGAPEKNMRKEGLQGSSTEMLALPAESSQMKWPLRVVPNSSWDPGFGISMSANSQCPQRRTNFEARQFLVADSTSFARGVARSRQQLNSQQPGPVHAGPEEDRASPRCSLRFRASPLHGPSQSGVGVGLLLFLVTCFCKISKIKSFPVGFPFFFY